MSFFGNVWDFEKSNFGTIWDQIKEDPERVFIGAIDPFSSKMWGEITGKDYEPMINQMGGASDHSYEEAEKQGIDTKSGKKMHDVAEVIASIYAGGEGMDALGGAFGGGVGGGSGSSTVGPATRGFASGSGAGQAAGSGGAGAGATDWGGLLQQFGSMPGGGGGAGGAQQPQQAQQPVQYAPQGGIQFKPVKPQYFGYFNPQQSTGLLG